MLQCDTSPCLKVLVAYYSHSGVTRAIAQEIREETCGVLYGVELCRPYPGHADPEQTQRAIKQRLLPAVKYAIPSMSAYDFILVGGPVWCDTAPAPLMSFLEKANFAGRHVAAFCVHQGIAGAYFKDVAALMNNAFIHDGLELNMSARKEMRGLEASLDTWLENLGLLCRKDIAI